MKAIIAKIDGRIIQAVIDNDVKEFELESWIKQEYMSLGPAEITVKDNKVSFVKMDSTKEVKEQSQNSTKKKPSSKWEDDIVSFEILLKKAHSLKTPFSIKTEMLAVDLEKKYALFKATVFVEDKKGSESLYYQGHGDATEQNVKGEHIKPHFIRMAETRAIVRALRWYTNNGCAEEEK